MSKVLISGYLGFGNCGDESILMAITSNLQQLDPDIHITALSNNPEITRQNYGIEALNAFYPLHIIKGIKNTDVLLSGGGTLLQDETSTRSLLYYLSIIQLAKFMGKKVMLYSNGIGPIHKSYNRKLVKKIINQVDLITLREELSKKEVEGLGITKPPIYVTADPVFTLGGISNDETRTILQKEGIPLDRPLIGVSVRNWKQSHLFIPQIAAICDYIVDYHQAHIVFIPMQYPNDLTMSNKIQEIMKNKTYILKKQYHSKEILGIVGSMKLILSMRLHTLIFAGIQNVPMVGFAYDPKVDYYLQVLQMPTAGDIFQLEVEKVQEQIGYLFKYYDDEVDKLRKISKSLIQKARKNDELLLKLIEKR